MTAPEMEKAVEAAVLAMQLAGVVDFYSREDAEILAKSAIGAALPHLVQSLSLTGQDDRLPNWKSIEDRARNLEFIASNEDKNGREMIGDVLRGAASDFRALSLSAAPECRAGERALAELKECNTLLLAVRSFQEDSDVRREIKEQVERNRAVLASASLRSAEGWQKIETAPLDGSLIETKYVSDDPKKVRWKIFGLLGVGWYVDGHDVRLNYVPTHWRPAAPLIAEQRQEPKP